MSDTQSRTRHSPNESRSTDRGERKRAWRDEGDREGGRSGGRDDRGSKQMKQGALGMKVLVPNSLVGAIIGKGGEEMKKLKEESSCFIRLSQNDKYFPNTNERPCYIEGMPEDIVKAVQAIQEKLMNDNPRRGPSIEDSRKKQCRIIVGSNAAGKCIGKGGENVKRLNSEHSVWVKVMGRDDSIPGLEERTVTINGELENSIKAVQDILEMSAALTNGGTDKNLDYDQYNGSGGGAGGGGQGYNQGGEGYNNQGGNFGNQQQGYNNQPGSGNMVRSGSMGAAPNMGRSGSSGPPSNMGGGYNNMGGGPAPPAANNMGGGPNMAVAPAMGGGNFTNQTPPVQQYNNPSQQPSQFGQPGQFQGGIQQYSGQNNANIPIQQYPGGNTGQATSGYGANPSGGYNQQPAGGYNQAGQGYNQQPTGAYNQPSTGGGYNQQAVAPVANPAGGAGGFNQSTGFNNQGSQGYQAPPVGNQGAGFQGGNQQGGFQGGNQGGNFQAGRGGYQGGRGGNQATGGRGNFRGGNNRGNGRGGSGRGGRGN